MLRVKLKRLSDIAKRFEPRLFCLVGVCHHRYGMNPKVCAVRQTLHPVP